MEYNVPLFTTEQQIKCLCDRITILTSQDVTRTVNGERKYHSSWRKRGVWEATANITRKLDRIDVAINNNQFNIFEAILNNKSNDGTVEGKDGLLDDIRDLRVYLLLVEDLIVNFIVPDLADPHI